MTHWFMTHCNMVEIPTCLWLIFDGHQVVHNNIKMGRPVRERAYGKISKWRTFEWCNFAIAAAIWYCEFEFVIKSTITGSVKLQKLCRWGSCPWQDNIADLDQFRCQTSLLDGCYHGYRWVSIWYWRRKVTISYSDLGR